MKMKLKYLLFLLPIILIGACDKIDGTKHEKIVVNDFCTTGIQDTVTHRKVLAEDYTGHLCGNCPYAGVYLNDTLQPVYNHCLVIISVHANYFATPCTAASGAPCPGSPTYNSWFSRDYRCTAGEDWYTFFGINGIPKGMINRVGYPTSTEVLAKEAWAGAIATELTKEAQVQLTITNDYNLSNRNVGVKVDSKFLNSLSGNYKLQVVLTEDSIIDYQEWYLPHTPQFDPTYIHRHLLRDALNSSWGEQIITGGASSGLSVTKNYNYTINNLWNENHCAIVAFVYDATTYEILQVEEVSVK